jgi:hypothetical protein
MVDPPHTVDSKSDPSAAASFFEQDNEAEHGADDFLSSADAPDADAHRAQ